MEKAPWFSPLLQAAGPLEITKRKRGENLARPKPVSGRVVKLLGMEDEAELLNPLSTYLRPSK